MLHRSHERGKENLKNFPSSFSDIFLHFSPFLFCVRQLMSPTEMPEWVEEMCIIQDDINEHSRAMDQHAVVDKTILCLILCEQKFLSEFPLSSQFSRIVHMINNVILRLSFFHMFLCPSQQCSSQNMKCVKIWWR